MENHICFWNEQAVKTVFSLKNTVLLESQNTGAVSARWILSQQSGCSHPHYACNIED
jgi:hypothetical protein